MDIDTCVQMASWNDFNAACEKLKAIGFTEEGPDHPEKMVDTNRQEVDLLPFGSLSEDGKTIKWEADTVATETLPALSEIFEKETERETRCPICHELAGYYRGSFSRARAILTAMRHGLEDGRS